MRNKEVDRKTFWEKDTIDERYVCRRKSHRERRGDMGEKQKKMEKEFHKQIGI